MVKGLPAQPAPPAVVAVEASHAIPIPLPQPLAPSAWRGFPLPVALPVAADILALGTAALLAGELNAMAASWVVLTFLGLLATDRHHLRINPQVSVDIVRLLAVPALTLAVVAVGATLVWPTLDLHRFLLLGLPAVPLVVAGRAAAYKVLRACRARRLLVDPTLIIGTGSVGVQITTTLLDRAEYGLLPVGFLGASRDTALPVVVLDDLTQLERTVRQLGVRRIIVAFGATPDEQLVDALRRCEALPVEVHVVPRFFETAAVPEGPEVEHLLGVPVVHLRRSALATGSWWTKRVMDITLAGIALVVAAPLMAAAAIAVKCSSPGPVLFRQRRIGQGGEPFDVLKFRSLPVNDDSDTTWSVAVDRRLTRIGRLLRTMNIDELPQLVNVLRGHMSLVGPRPERPHFVGRFSAEIPWYATRHRVPVGLTGLAQVHGLRGDTSIPNRARLDNHYIAHWSPWLDVAILLRTVWVVLRGGGH